MIGVQQYTPAAFHGSGACVQGKGGTIWSKASEIRSEIFGELSVINHGETHINQISKLQFILIYDGATYLTNVYVVQTRAGSLTISHLQEYFETYHVNPKCIVADQAFLGTEMEEYDNH